MTLPARKPATYADLEALPDHVTGQLIDGELYASPRPGTAHAHASSSLGGELHSPFDRGRGGPGGWWILDEPELHFGNDVLVPDLAGWRREKLPQIPNAPFLTAVPDWICEIVSPSTAGLDRIKKMPRYATIGVSHAWIIDPVAHTLEVFRQQQEHWLLIGTFGADEKVRAEPFDAIELELSALWL